jgi:hypothetical protein
MAEKFDVASRLAEGRPAVDDLAACVWACHLLGYTNPDLTLHAAQVRDWYSSEDGLDLRALDADCAALKSAVGAAEEALARQDEQLGALAGAWQGGGADASKAFLHRHGEASAAAAAAVRTAADALATLRDDLWRAVDGKVAAAVAVDARAPDEWLAAAHTVTTGGGDRAAASERVDREVKPFVANDIGGEWLTAMRSATAAVTDSYDAATAELTGERDAAFDVPGDLGPTWTPVPRDDGVATVPAAATPVAPSVSGAPAWSAPAVSPVSPPVAPAPAPAAPLPSAPVDAGPTAPAMATPPSAPSLGGMPDIGSGLGGFGQQLADALGGLFGSTDDGLLDPPDLDEPEIDEDLDDEEDDDDLGDEPEGPEDDEVVEPAAEEFDEPADPAVAEPVCEPVDVPDPVEPSPEPVATPVPEPPPPDDAPPPPEPPPEPVAAETPCEIAADEVPQVGQ